MMTLERTSSSNHSMASSEEAPTASVTGRVSPDLLFDDSTTISSEDDGFTIGEALDNVDHSQSSTSPYLSPNSKVKDLIESPIINKSKMLPRRFLEQQTVVSSQLDFDDENSLPPVELGRAHDTDNGNHRLVDTSAGSAKFDVSPEANGGPNHNGNPLMKQDAPSLSRPFALPFANTTQRSITHYLTQRGSSPRAMALLNASISKTAAAASGRLATLDSGRNSNSSDSDNSNSSQGSLSRGSGVGVNRKGTSLASSPSSLKRSLSCTDASSTRLLSPAGSPQGSPKRSSGYVPLSRGSLALKAIQMAGKSSASPQLAFSSSTSTASDESSSESTGKEPPSTTKSILRSPFIPKPASERKGITNRVSFAAPLVTSELYFDANSASLGLERLFNGSPSLRTLKPTVTVPPVEETDPNDDGDDDMPATLLEADSCAVKKRRINDNSTVVTSIEFRSRNDAYRSLRNARTCINLFADEAEEEVNKANKQRLTTEISLVQGEAEEKMQVEQQQQAEESMEVASSSQESVDVPPPDEVTLAVMDALKEREEEEHNEVECQFAALEESTLVPSSQESVDSRPSDEVTLAFMDAIKEHEEEEKGQSATLTVAASFSPTSPEPEDVVDGGSIETSAEAQKNIVELEDSGPIVEEIEVYAPPTPEEIPETAEFSFQIPSSQEEVVVPTGDLEVEKKPQELDVDSDDPSEIGESPLKPPAPVCSPASTIFSTLATTLSSSISLPSSAPSVGTVLMGGSRPTNSVVTSHPLISSPRALSILKQAVNRSPSSIVFVEKPSVEVTTSLDAIDAQGAPASPPNSSQQQPQRLPGIGSLRAPSASSSSFLSPFARRGSACLQAAKAKLRRDTPMPVNRTKLPIEIGTNSPKSANAVEELTASTGNGTKREEAKPKSILRESIYEDTSKSSFFGFWAPTANFGSRHKKRVVFTEPLVTSSVEFDASAACLIICDTLVPVPEESAPTPTLDLPLTSCNDAQLKTVSSAALCSSMEATVSTTGNTVTAAVEEPKETIVVDFSNGSTPTTASSLQRKPLYHQNSTFVEDGEQGLSGVPSIRRSLDDTLLVADSDADDSSLTSQEEEGGVTIIDQPSPEGSVTSEDSTAVNVSGSISSDEEDASMIIHNVTLKTQSSPNDVPEGDDELSSVPSSNSTQNSTPNSFDVFNGIATQAPAAGLYDLSPDDEIAEQDPYPSTSSRFTPSPSPTFGSLESPPAEQSNMERNSHKPMAHSQIQLEEEEEDGPMIDIRLPLKLARELYAYFGRYLDAHDQGRRRDQGARRNGGGGSDEDESQDLSMDLN